MMSIGTIAYLLVHPQQLRSIIQWKVWHEPVHQHDKSKETETEKICNELLVLTSRSFVAVIQELHPEILMPMTTFYLVLRGLDTIEDDMTIPIEKKEPLLRHFDQKLEIDGWTFNESGPNEKDRDCLVKFDNVIVELRKLKKPYYDIIKDTTIRMGNGMADYAVNAEHNEKGVQSIEDYELYCHYVAGLLGEACTRLFVEGNLANPMLLKRSDLYESMGQFLQQTNIIRDIREDFDDGRKYWPREIWSKHVDEFGDLFKPEFRTQARNCQSEMVLNALKNVEDVLFYLCGLREQSVFNFCAIPQAMAIATLELVFNNHAMFERNIKIARGVACQLMIESTQNMKVLSATFKRYTRRIHQKNDPRDPNFLNISLQCAKIEQFIESIFPTQDIKQIEAAQKAQENADEQKLDFKEAGLLIGITLLMLAIVGGLMIGLAWYLGARFDRVLSDHGLGSVAEDAATTTLGHGEL